MPLAVASRRLSAAALARRYPGARVIDVTSRGPEPWVRLSPFYPHGGIPVPLTPGTTSESVEGIWQALKVFERADVDPGKLRITTMKNLKRSSRSFGRVLGHRAGLHGDQLLPYREARVRIYVPAYCWVLEHPAAALVEELRQLARDQEVVLLDYTVNGDVDDESRPLSHAALVQRCVEGRWPAGD